jgi:hypothetical protein
VTLFAIVLLVVFSICILMSLDALKMSG